MITRFLADKYKDASYVLNAGIEKKSHDCQDLRVPTKLCVDKDFCSYFEFDVGYRYDNISTLLEVLTLFNEIKEHTKNKANIAQLNLKAGMRFYKYMFLNGSVGYGILGSDKNDLRAVYADTDIVANEVTHSTSSGYAFDWLFGGGMLIPIYKQIVALLPEVGYQAKKIHVEDTLNLRIASPYIGGKLCTAPGYNFGLTVYGSYFLSPRRTQNAFYKASTGKYVEDYNLKSQNHMPSYILGANVSYLFTSHLSVSLNWERFASSSKRYDMNLPLAIDEVQKLNHWISNQYTAGIRYTF